MPCPHNHIDCPCPKDCQNKYLPRRSNNQIKNLQSCWFERRQPPDRALRAKKCDNSLEERGFSTCCKPLPTRILLRVRRPPQSTRDQAPRLPPRHRLAEIRKACKPLYRQKNGTSGIFFTLQNGNKWNNLAQKYGKALADVMSKYFHYGYFDVKKLWLFSHSFSLWEYEAVILQPKNRNAHGNEEKT